MHMKSLQMISLQKSLLGELCLMWGHVLSLLIATSIAKIITAVYLVEFAKPLLRGEKFFVSVKFERENAIASITEN